jgi:hypothetical protein
MVRWLVVGGGICGCGLMPASPDRRVPLARSPVGQVSSGGADRGGHRPDRRPSCNSGGQLAAGTVNWLVPLAPGAAVLRLRLYDLDRIFSCTSPTGCPSSCSATATPASSLSSADSSGATPAWSLPPRPRRDRAVPAGPPPHPAGGGPPLQPTPLRRRPEDRGLRRKRVARQWHARD